MSVQGLASLRQDQFVSLIHRSRVGMYMYMQISTHIYPLPRVSGENIVRDVHIGCTVQDDVILFSFHSNCVRVFSFHTG